MTEKKLAEIEREANRRWPLDATLIVHRYGRLEPGDRIVLVATASPHREAALAACDFLIDWLKTDAPFWKREETPDGERWVEARADDDAATQKWRDPEYLRRRGVLPRIQPPAALGRGIGRGAGMAGAEGAATPVARARRPRPRLRLRLVLPLGASAGRGARPRHRRVGADAGAGAGRHPGAGNHLRQGGYGDPRSARRVVRRGLQLARPALFRTSTG